MSANIWSTPRVSRGSHLRPFIRRSALLKKKNHVSRFSILNGGIVIVARNTEVDDKKKMMMLLKPSIINGSETQGELKKFYDDYTDPKTKKFNEDYSEPSIRYEIIVIDDDDLIAEISIARNFQNDVRRLSIVGRRGHLDALEKRMTDVCPDWRLQKSESDQNDREGAIDTEKLVQVAFAALPVEMMATLRRKSDPENKRQLDPENKVFSYNQKAHCLKLFEELVDRDD